MQEAPRLIQFFGELHMKRTVWLLVILAVLCLSIRAVFSTTVRAVAVVAGLPRRLPIYSVMTDEKKVAISFDAAWGAEYTPRLLEILKKHGVKATFFLVGFWIERYPEVTRRIFREGHELGNHTENHPHLTRLSREEIAREILSVHQRLKKITGKDATLFRPPFGEYDDAVIEVAESLGYQTIQWSVDSLDWREPSPAALTERVCRRVHPGAIVLFHNNARCTAEALDEILSRLIQDGWKLVPISELLIKGAYYIDHQGRQCPKPGPDLAADISR